MTNTFRITDKTQLTDIHSTYVSAGSAYYSDDLRLTVDPGQLPDGRNVKVYYDLEGRDDGDENNWGIEFAVMATIG
jgi:hypothetical protein